MKNAVICGAGKMGMAIGRAMRQLGYSISIIEHSRDNVLKFCEHNGECLALHHWSQINSPTDVFISALPYHATLDAAVWCIDNEIRYCDLGGSVPVSHDIKEVAERGAKYPVMTDLGLAPGWVNIAAEEMYHLMPDASSISMMVGGIPAAPHEFDPLKYKITWSVDGLLNEYMDNCVTLERGKIFSVPGLSQLEEININGMQLEAFTTSGASSHTIEVMAKRGIKNCYYKTLRWPGHCNMVRYLLDATNRSVVEELLNHSSNFYADDLVILNVVAKNGYRTMSKSLTIHPDNGFSAMQKATAFPLAAVADIIGQGLFDKIKCPTYADIPLDIFNKNLQGLLHGETVSATI